MSSVITLQAGVRKMIALRRYNRMKIEVSAHARAATHCATIVKVLLFCDFFFGMNVLVGFMREWRAGV